MSSPHDLAAELLTAFRTPAAAAAGTASGSSFERPVAQPPVPLGPPIRFTGRQRDRSSLLTVLEKRRSIRFFGPQPVDASLIADVAARGIETDLASWPQQAERVPLQINVVAFRLSGLEPGMYGLDTGLGTGSGTKERSYVPVAPLPDGEALYDLTIQREFCDSAAIISLAADLDLASQLDGAHGYRTLMTRAAAAAYTMWLDAVAVGLVGTVFAGFIPASVRLPLRSDGASRHQLFALALGGVLAPPSIPPGPTSHR
ncbi:MULTISPECIES: nitroreductase family protein [unclassified Streptomyces]|uniref:nitroreductase family protein n=1 Tax=unclassified Streptomyces TaxID=2593676 RepID=UPI001BE7FE5D|nr:MULTISPECIES: nitroreductase family protein [unclassified Streptomyces]MBT2406290.1 nitroreductase family protein [Streptomyces sp. ISL-21]MBT2607393.1 nitroreductase family protein [Streptomyces sp. ISL-87]